MVREKRREDLDTYIDNRYIRKNMPEGEKAKQRARVYDKRVRDKANKSLSWLTRILQVLPENQLKQIFTPEAVNSFLTALFLQTTKGKPKILGKCERRDRLIRIASDLLLLLKDEFSIEVTHPELWVLTKTGSKMEDAWIQAIYMARKNLDHLWPERSPDME